MNPAPHYNKATFCKSAVELEQLPADTGSEVAFIGCSNAGKSSALNTITGQKGLARISKTPGRTQAINIFDLGNKQQRLIDLPGYGYAKVPKAVRERWGQTIDAYLQDRESLSGLVLLMDIRHPLKPLDQHLIEWTMSCHLPVHILLTKADKLSRNQQRKTLNEVTEALGEYGDLISVQIFSSVTREGVDDAKTVLDELLVDE
jgi:GTP-binding protein